MNESAKRLLNRLESGDQADDILFETSQYVEITVGDLRNACLANQTHPKARVLIRSVETMADHTMQSVDKIDLLGILKNREVVPHQDGFRRFKTLGDECVTGQAVDAIPVSMKTIPDEEPEIGSTSPADGTDADL